MVRAARSLIILFCITTFAGCGNAAGTTPVTLSPPAIPPSGQTGTARIALSFSTGSSGSATQRRTRSYVSPKTKSVGIYVTTINGKPPAPPIARTVLDVGPSAQNCTTSGSTINCVLPVTLPAGSVGLSVRTYPLPSSGIDSAGNIPLSIGNVVATVTAGQTVDAPVNLLPVVFPDITGVSFSISPSPIAGDQPGTATLTITAKDSAGDVIGGSDPYYQPIVITSADTSGHVTTSPVFPAKITAPGQTITLSYDGKGSAGYYILTYSIASDSIVNGVQGNAGALAFTQNGEHVYVSSQSTNAVYVYAAGPSGSNTLVRTIVGPKTTIAGPVAIAVDKNGAVYVVNYQRDVTVFAPGADGDVAPMMTFAGGTGHPESIELVSGLDPVTTGPSDTSDQYRTTTRTQYYNDIYQPAPLGGGSRATDFPASGLTAHATSPINGQACWLQNPPYSNPWMMCTHSPADGRATLSVVAGRSLAFRSDGLLAVSRPPYANHVNDSVATYTVLASGQLQESEYQPKYDLSGPSTGLSVPDQIAFDKAGNMYVANIGSGSNQGRVTVYAPNATGDAAPVRTICCFTSSGGVAVGP